MHPFLLSLTILFFCAASLRADTVTLSSAKDSAGTIEVSGEVIDFTGREILIRGPGGNERKFPAERVVKVDTRWPDGFEQGTIELEAGNYAQASELLAAAARADQRPWVRRLAMQRLMECYAAAGDVATAGRLLVELAKSDPSTGAIQHAPLAWFASDNVPPATDAEWLATNQPATQLLGASYALSGSDRPAALNVLKQLMRLADDQFAPLAEMQSWRAEIITAKPTDVARWEARVEKFAEPIQAGGWLVIAETRRQLHESDAAALAYLRASQLAEGQPQLAAHALWQAARVLDDAGHADEATKLARQTVADYPKTAAAAEARSMLQSAD
jgi:tetratricopeptide (TPR) repeat protein